MRRYVQYVIIIHQNLTMYMYVDLILKKTVSNIIYKYTHFYEELVYALKYH